MSSGNDIITTPKQLLLDLQIAVEKEVDGVGMGVLSDGTPYLNIRGLARLCGVDHANIIRITSDWQNAPLRPREKRIRELVVAQGADDERAFMAVEKDGSIQHILPAAVSMAVLEYYAFESKPPSEHALHSFRTLARKGFIDFVYAQVGYNPSGESSIAWQQFHDRVLLSHHTVPDGYFSIFKEISGMIVTMIRAGAEIGPDFVPDISVGRTWSDYWKSESLDIMHGERIKYEHNYPDYFPQAASNPQHPYCYPDDALGEFRTWVRVDYIAKRMPKYLNDKVRQGKLSAPAATAAIEAFEAPGPKRIPADAPAPLDPKKTR